MPDFIKKETGTGVFCEFFQISKNTFFTEHFRGTVFEEYNGLRYYESFGENWLTKDYLII